MMPNVSIIVLNWNGRDDTLECLASLSRLDYVPCEVVVVDNGSSDDSVPAIRSAHPRLQVIETGCNLGYVGGNNVGLEHAQARGADYALLLNNDTIVTGDFLSLLVQAAEANPAVGIVGPTIYYADRPDVIWSAGGAIDWKLGSTYMIGLDEVDCGQFGERPRPVDFITGCALLIKMSAVRRMGLLDPRFFAYYEETEWCVRATRAGFRILHVPLARIWHKISPSAQPVSPTVHYYMTRNRLLFLQATRAGWQAWGHTCSEYLRTLVSWSVRPRWRKMRVQRAVMVWAISDYFAHRLGRAPDRVARLAA